MKRVLFRSRDGRELHSRFSSYTAPFLLNGNGSCCFFDTTGSPSLAAGTVFVLVRTIFRPGFPVCCLLNQQSRRRPSPFRHRLITVLAPPCTGLAPAEPLPGDAANLHHRHPTAARAGLLYHDPLFPQASRQGDHENRSVATEGCEAPRALLTSARGHSRPASLVHR